MTTYASVPDVTLKIGNGTVRIFGPKNQTPEETAKAKADIEQACQPILLRLAARGGQPKAM